MRGGARGEGRRCAPLPRVCLVCSLTVKRRSSSLRACVVAPFSLLLSCYNYLLLFLGCSFFLCCFLTVVALLLFPLFFLWFLVCLSWCGQGVSAKPDSSFNPYAFVIPSPASLVVSRSETSESETCSKSKACQLSLTCTQHTHTHTHTHTSTLLCSHVLPKNQTEKHTNTTKQNNRHTTTNEHDTNNDNRPQFSACHTLSLSLSLSLTRTSTRTRLLPGA